MDKFRQTGLVDDSLDVFDPAGQALRMLEVGRLTSAGRPGGTTVPFQTGDAA